MFLRDKGGRRQPPAARPPSYVPNFIMYIISIICTLYLYYYILLYFMCHEKDVLHKSQKALLESPSINLTQAYTCSHSDLYTHFLFLTGGDGASTSPAIFPFLS